MNIQGHLSFLGVRAHISAAEVQYQGMLYILCHLEMSA